MFKDAGCARVKLEKRSVLQGRGWVDRKKGRCSRGLAGFIKTRARAVNAINTLSWRLVKARK